MKTTETKKDHPKPKKAAAKSKAIAAEKEPRPKKESAKEKVQAEDKEPKPRKGHATEKDEIVEKEAKQKKESGGKKEPAEVVVELSHLRKSFEGHHVLKDINLSVFKGENMVVLGKSGEGKSVMIKCMMRLIEPDAGTVMILGEDVTKMGDEELNEVRKKVGFLFQSAALYDSMTVRENLEFPLRDLKKPQQEVDGLVEEVLENVGLLEAIEKMPSELSGGMRKRIGLARTLILKPEIILYDEPTAGLDPVTAKEICELIVDVQKKYKASAIIITHDLECARITANRMVVLQEGECTNEGTFEDLQKSKDKFVMAFFNKI